MSVGAAAAAEYAVTDSVAAPCCRYMRACVLGRLLVVSTLYNPPSISTQRCCLLPSLKTNKHIPPVVCVSTLLSKSHAFLLVIFSSSYHLLVTIKSYTFQANRTYRIPYKQYPPFWTVHTVIEICILYTRISMGSCCCSTSVQDSLQAIWSKRLFKLLTRWLAIVCAVLSALILWSELVMSSSLHSPIGMMMGAYSSHPRDHTVLAQVSKAHMLVAWHDIAWHGMAWHGIAWHSIAQA